MMDYRSDASPLFVIPAKAGIQSERLNRCPWTPAFAGVTRGGWTEGG